MTYQILILRKAQKELGSLENKIFRRINDAIRNLSKNPRPEGSIKLTNRDSWRIRVGSYRVVYRVDDDQQTILVLTIGHRKDVYRSDLN